MLANTKDKKAKDASNTTSPLFSQVTLDSWKIIPQFPRHTRLSNGTYCKERNCLRHSIRSENDSGFKDFDLMECRAKFNIRNTESNKTLSEVRIDLKILNRKIKIGITKLYLHI